MFGTIAKVTIVFWTILIMLSCAAMAADIVMDVPITPEYLIAIIFTGLILNSVGVAVIYYVKKPQ